MAQVCLSIMWYKLRRLANTALAGCAFMTALPCFQIGVYLYFLFGRITERKRMSLHRFLQRKTAWAARKMPATDYVVDNPHGETFDKPAVIICNHQSHLDLVYLLSLSPKLVVLTNDWVWRCPFYNILIHRAEFYPVSNGMESNMPRLRSLVSRGYSIVVFPEGTRSQTRDILRFHQGAFSLAAALGTDILPLMLYGSGILLTKHKRMLSPAHIRMTIGARFPASEPYRLQAKKVREDYRQWYSDVCKTCDPLTEKKQRECGRKL